MSSDLGGGEYEFNQSQNELIGSLARKMGLVGIVMLLFGVLQIINGVATLAVSRNPDRMMEAAEKAGMSEDQLGALRQALAGGEWSSPIVASSIAMAVGGLILVLVGWWTRQAGSGFGGIVATRGQDVSRLMEALGALHRKYSLMYTILVVAALLVLASLVAGLWQGWRGGA
jgi:hypothetical protein